MYANMNYYWIIIYNGFMFVIHKPVSNSDDLSWKRMQQAQHILRKFIKKYCTYLINLLQCFVIIKNIYYIFVFKLLY